MANDKPQELHTAESSDQVIKGTGDTVITDRHGPKVSTASANVTHKRGSGFGTTNFDGVAPPPHLRHKVADDPRGEKNKELLEKHKAEQAKQS